MDSDSDSPFNYSWPSFPKMRMRRKTGKKGNRAVINRSSSPTLAAAARLSAMIHGKDRVYANAMLVDQVSGAEISVSFFEMEITVFHVCVYVCVCVCVCVYVCVWLPPCLCVCICVNSPSLECDSGEEDILGHSYPCSSSKQQSILRSSLGEERDSFNTSPDFNRTHSSSSQKSTKTDCLIEDEEWDKYIIPSKVESEKYKVSRTFSFLKSRMSSTRNKTKVKGKEVKEGKEKSGATNGHQFVPVSPSGPALCVACDKSVSGKELLQCSNCFLNVHKNCRESVAACGKTLFIIFVLTDAVDAPLLSDLSADLLGLDAESWSLAVSPEFCRQHDRHTVKRQDVIYGENILSFFRPKTCVTSI
uniref:Phorbol-ester/DAG-type domain-containing protein n=1 Tax=Seriola dumerili TaxID=41447 RepID=A0A3B4VL09_SERDU